MAQVLAKEYECLNCKQPIRLQRKEPSEINPNNPRASKWNKFNLDNSIHSCFNKSSNQIEQDRAEEQPNNQLSLKNPRIQQDQQPPQQPQPQPQIPTEDNLTAKQVALLAEQVRNLAGQIEAMTKVINIMIQQKNDKANGNGNNSIFHANGTEVVFQ